jgi:HSP20 family protein
MWLDPFEEMRQIEDRMNKLFRELWGGRVLPLTGDDMGRHALVPVDYREPYADLQETDDEVIVTAEMPGVDKGDINLKVGDDRLEITAEKKHESEEKKRDVYLAERSYSKFYKALSLPTKVLVDKAKATYKNGVLEIRLPKAKPEKKRRIKVE